MKRLLISAGTLVFVGAMVVSATGAFFSDTETSTGNTFAAGAIDLLIDNTSYVTDCNIRPTEQNPNPPCTGALVASAATSWTLRDLTIEKFFDFVDLKPGDQGEDTISIHVQNDAWMCAEAVLTEDADNDITEPEDEVAGPNNDDNDGTVDGDLDSELNFAFWVDDGDNVFESDESVFLSGPLSNIDDAGQFALADSEGSILPDDGPIPGGTTFYIGKMWCFGELTPDPVTQNGNGSSTPLVLGTGWDCDGSEAGNIAQTDSVVGNLTFYAEQARNNGDFVCEPSEDPEPVITRLTLEKSINQDETSPVDESLWTLTASSTNTMTKIQGIESSPAVSSAIVQPGTYVLSESVVEGFSETNLVCGGNATPLVDHTLTIAPGEQVVCTFTNTENTIQ